MVSLSLFIAGYHHPYLPMWDGGYRGRVFIQLPRSQSCWVEAPELKYSTGLLQSYVFSTKQACLPINMMLVKVISYMYCHSKQAHTHTHTNNVVNNTEWYNENLIIKDCLIYFSAPKCQEALQASICPMYLAFLHVLLTQISMTVFLEPLNGLIALHLTSKCRMSTLWPIGWVSLQKGKPIASSGARGGRQL